MGITAIIPCLKFGTSIGIGWRPMRHPWCPLYINQCFKQRHTVQILQIGKEAVCIVLFSWAGLWVCYLNNRFHKRLARLGDQWFQGTSNVLMALTQFESLLKSGGLEQLSRVYSILLSLTTVEDGVRRRWEMVTKKDLLSAVSDRIFHLMWQLIKLL